MDMRRKYLEAVKINHLATESQDRDLYSKHTTHDPNGSTFMAEDRFVEMTTSSNMETTIVPVVQQKTGFYCPLGKHAKYEGVLCREVCSYQATKDKIVVNGGLRLEDHLKWCIVRKEVVFDHDLCVNAYLEDDLP
jgi:hypothetical protein